MSSCTAGLKVSDFTHMHMHIKTWFQKGDTFLQSWHSCSEGVLKKMSHEQILTNYLLFLLKWLLKALGKGTVPCPPPQNQTHQFFKEVIFMSDISFFCSLLCFSLYFFSFLSFDLSRFIIDECRGLTQETCDVLPVLSQAMEALQDRPVLYKWVNTHTRAHTLCQLTTTVSSDNVQQVFKNFTTVKLNWSEGVD